MLLGFSIREALTVVFIFATYLDQYFSAVGMNSRLSDFLMLFRTLIPDLYNHFEEEEVDFKDCATSWFQYLLSKELPMDCMSRVILMFLNGKLTKSYIHNRFIAAVGYLFLNSEWFEFACVYVPW
jgi:hypothetical protein